MEDATIPINLESYGDIYSRYGEGGALSSEFTDYLEGQFHEIYGQHEHKGLFTRIGDLFRHTEPTDYSRLSIELDLPATAYSEEMERSVTESVRGYFAEMAEHAGEHVEGGKAEGYKRIAMGVGLIGAGIAAHLTLPALGVAELAVALTAHSLEPLGCFGICSGLETLLDHSDAAKAQREYAEAMAEAEITFRYT